MERILCVDVDNTLGDYTGGLRDYVTACTPRYACPDPIAYDFTLTPDWPFTGSMRNFLWWHKRAVAAGLYRRETPYPHAAETLTRLHDNGWRIIVSTARRDDPDGQTARWLRNNDIPYDGLHYGDKLDIRFDLLIDDRPDTLERAARETDAIILHPDHAYCKDAPGLTFHDWDEIPGLIGMADNPDSLQ